MNKTQHIIDILRAAGVDACWSGAHEGVCLTPYCVVQQTSGAQLNPAGGYVRYRVHLYVPCDRPELLDDFAETVRGALRSAEEAGWLTLEQPRGASAINDSYRAVYSYIEYVSYYSQI